ncbi:CDP-diacylglycerol--serine O-phosphatidyltransferase [Vibrio sp. SCSIO 43136]|uniref:CDP-diacylglycerol--serine O-phosphatidyltransferase n=1 Tax=Vibrio sp. SCSIO 43136 TaxID=2819101 RepID=UPI002074B553|nr:CDP-diacylglycerol--serine O-phosphatidyltransferase [Vibrio sp. SCSIO 43136]USD65413.1 CDP-diacylglycerol--serine O-phosphatidyltransferase [Vibrio sp. SCSIO 43136]
MIAIRDKIGTLPTIATDPANFNILHSAEQFRTHLLEAIREANSRIYIAALYLEDDEAGREILTAMYEAKQANPDLDIKICVDWHRAQRGLIGAAHSEGNAAMYREFAKEYKYDIPVFGIPVRGREVFGVLHLKGFIVDDQVIYSGASLNNIYLNKQDRYRFDRYHIVDNAELADSMVRFIQEEMISHAAVNNLASTKLPTTKSLKTAIRQFRSKLARSQYHFTHQIAKADQIAITPIVGLGKRRNTLNQSIVELVNQAKDEIFICTPYFNFPKELAKAVKKALKRGVKVSIVVGDKTANDFYIPPTQSFSTIGGLPYLYEMNLRRFAKINEAFLASRQLSLHLWKHDSNSYHLKGMWVDKRYMLLTGNNLNPRAWKLDLENALLVQDHNALVVPKFEQEIENILQHTELVCTYRQIDKIDTYPVVVQKLIRKIRTISADRVLKQLL